MARQQFTFYDAIEHLKRFTNSRGLVGQTMYTWRQACIDAYQEVSESYAWMFAKKFARVNLQAAVSTGTIGYVYTGGTYERELTLSDSTWPSDAHLWSVLIDDVVYDIDTRESSTVVTLSAGHCPVADIDDGTSYEAFQRYYILPDDFIASGDALAEETSNILGTYVSYETLMTRMRTSADSGEQLVWSLAPVPEQYGRWGLFVQPPAGTAQTVDIPYRAMPRELRYSGAETAASVGTVSISSGAKAVTGVDTTFSSLMVGAMLRIGSSATIAPSGLQGQQPYAEEFKIATHTGATAITTYAAASSAHSAVKYTVTDPIDLDRSAVQAFLRTAEKHLLHACGKYTQADERGCRLAMMRARTGKTTHRRRVAGHETLIPLRPTTVDYEDVE